MNKDQISRSTCPICGTLMSKDGVRFPDNPTRRRQRWICSRDGKVKYTKIEEQGVAENDDGD